MADRQLHFLDRYAFNYHRQAYDFRVPQEYTKGITIHVSSLSKPINSQLSEAIKCRPPIIPHMSEMDPQVQDKTVECIWVGMRPSDQQLPLEDCPEADVPKKLKKGYNIAGMNPADIHITPFDPRALRVVAKKGSRVNQYYALINPDPQTSLCQGYIVPNDQVFFFRPFRDDSAKAVETRRGGFARKVRAIVSPPAEVKALAAAGTDGDPEMNSSEVGNPSMTTPSSFMLRDETELEEVIQGQMEPEADQSMPRSPTSTAGDSTSPELQLRTSSAQHLVALVSELESRGDFARLNQAIQIIESHVRGEGARHEGFLGICMNIPTEEISEARSRQLLDEFEDFFPRAVEQTDIQPSEFHLMLRGLRLTGMQPRYDVICPFTEAFCEVLRAGAGQGHTPKRLSRPEAMRIVCVAMEIAKSRRNSQREPETTAARGYLP